MSWILFYDQPQITAPFVAHLQPTNGIASGPFYPSPQTTENEIRWEGKYTTDNNGKGKLEVADRNYLYLFYNSDRISPNAKFEGETFLFTRQDYLQKFTYLMEKMGLNVVEENDMITTWTMQMEDKPFTLLTIISPESINHYAHLRVDGFEQYHRIIVAIEPLTSSQLATAIKIKTIKKVEEVTPRQRPTGKYIVEWGGLFTSEFD